jgi:pyruvate/2-oxoacid:ferredoxin oxidoreductase alpha subunit
MCRYNYQLGGEKTKIGNMRKSKEEHIADAKRHIENAREILREKGKKEDGFYTDAKYVAIAGHTAYRGILIALNELMKQHGIKKSTRKHVDDYQDFLAKLDRKILNHFNIAYEILHLVMGYDGFGEYDVVKKGLNSAEEIINGV